MMGLEAELDFEKRGGLVPAVTQDYESGEVLMLAYVNRQALDETLRTGFATYYSTSRDELWVKGAGSGYRMAVQEIRVDCDQDALLYRVSTDRGACHTKGADGNKRRSCFYRRLEADYTLEELF